MVRDGQNFNFTRSWILLLGYWGICSQLPILGLDRNTFSDMLVHSFVLSGKRIKGIQDMFLVVFCTILTIPSIWIYMKVAHGGGRAVRPVTCLAFAVMNGVFETRSFASSFDFGRLFVQRIGDAFGLENWYVGPASFIVGSLTMMIYSGLIHALFWEKFILPPHLSHPSNSKIDPQESECRSIPGFFSPRVRPTKANMIKSLTATSLAWMMFYHVTNELWLVVQLHCLIDGGVGIATRIQPPIELF